jgi:TolB-like protein/tetratricopeptide (TPR) repeat protein
MTRNLQVQVRVDESGLERNSAIPSDAIRTELEKILASRTFRSAQGQKRFLRYAVEEAIAGRGNLIKEYMIGTEALGRRESFDPRLDPIVRTQARKLRARLTKYYETEGVDDPLRIEFPKGSYAPTFHEADSSGPVQNAQLVEAQTPTPIDPPAESHPPLEAAIPPDISIELDWKIAAIAFAVLALVGSVALYFSISGSRGSVATSDRPSVAVLPFTNLGDNSEDEFLSDGLTEDLINSLAQVPGLQVVARTSAFRFKGKTSDLRDVGQKLNVRTVLVGSVRRSANHVRVTVQLNSASDGYHLWTGSYDRVSNDVRTVQWEIAGTVSNILRAGVTRTSRHDLEKSFPNLASPNPGAYQSYLKGLYFWNKLTLDGLKTAVQYFEQAIAEDPSFARAHAALAYCYVMAPQMTASPPPDIASKIRAAASKAHELDSTLGEAHIDLAISAEYEFDWVTAEREFKKGLALSPGSAVGHLWYAKYLALLGRKDEVLVHRKVAAELDPVSPYALQAVGGYYSVMGRYDDAIEHFRNALALEPNFWLTHQGLGTAYLFKGMHAEAIEELQLANKLIGGPRRMAFLGYAYAASGNKAEARRILDGFLEQSRRGPFPALAIATIYIGLGDKDRAFEWLAKAIDQKDLNVALQWDILYGPLRSDPRYAQLLRRMKLA